MDTNRAPDVEDSKKVVVGQLKPSYARKLWVSLFKFKTLSRYVVGADVKPSHGTLWVRTSNPLTVVVGHLKPSHDSFWSAETIAASLWVPRQTLASSFRVPRQTLVHMQILIELLVEGARSKFLQLATLSSQV